MKASEFISQVALMIKEHGDLDIIVGSPYCEPCTIEPKGISFQESDFHVAVFEIYGE